VASRTDAGVHALGNVAAFETTRDIDPQGWLRGLNAEGPKDIAVTEVQACCSGLQSEI
jgi:tRNA pseudouridine38-40 synthase